MPIAPDTLPIEHALTNLTLGEPVMHGALAVVPLLADPRPGAGADPWPYSGLGSRDTAPWPDPDWVTLADPGVEAQITEATGEGSVPTLRVTNDGDRPLLLLDGEELVGARQNRVLDTTVLVAAHSSITIPVSCVEQGRWAYRSRGLKTGGVSLYASLRAAKAAQVTESVRRGERHRSDQVRLWHALAARAARHAPPTETGAMHDVFEHHARTIAEAREALAPRPAQVGSLVFVAGHWLGLDLLASERLFRRAWPRLCAGYAADALGRRARPEPRQAPAAVLKEIAQSPAIRVPAIGLGHELRLTGRTVAGAALVVDDRVAHLMAFPAAADAWWQDPGR
jgi:hypothetical protein